MKVEKAKSKQYTNSLLKNEFQSRTKTRNVVVYENATRQS